MSEQDRKNLLSHIRKTMNEDRQSAFQTEHERLGVNPKPVPGRKGSVPGIVTSGAKLGRRSVSQAGAKRTRTLMGMPAVPTIPSVGTHQDHTWSPDMPHTGSQPEPEYEDIFPNEEEHRVRLDDLPKRPQPTMCSLDQAEPYDYCLLFKGNVVAVESDSKRIEAFVESLLRSFENATPDDIMVFRRMPVKVGALIG